MSTTERLDKQYADSRKLAARARLNQEYTISELPWFPWVAQQLQFENSDSVLDVGCGAGWFWTSVAETLPRTLTLTLVDASAGMIAEALKHCSELPLKSVEGRIADVVALPFKDNSFNCVIAMHMLYHASNPAAGIAEISRVLKPGGWLAVTTNGAGNKREIHELANALGGMACDPAAQTFGCDTAVRMMQDCFGNVELRMYPARMCITDPDDLFLALTSYPPGDEADDIELAGFRKAIDNAFRSNNGVLEVRIETGLLLSRKT